MNGVKAVTCAFEGAHTWYRGTVADLTAAQAGAIPPGVANPIAELMAHVLQSEDFMVNTAVHGKPTLWERDGWDAKVGGKMVAHLPARSTERAEGRDLKAMSEYAEAVFASTKAFLGGLKDSDLDREVNLVQFGFPNNMGLGAFLTTMLLGNTYAHTGEISALKGVFGKKGYPF